jgi:hypothetical protein
MARAVLMCAVLLAVAMCIGQVTEVTSRPVAAAVVADALVCKLFLAFLSSY